MRKINSSALKVIIQIYAIAHSLFILYTSYFGVFLAGIQRPLHLMFLLPLGFLLYPANKNSPKNQPSLTDYILCVLSILVCFYALVNNQRFMYRWLFVDPVYLLDRISGIIAIILVIEATRRVVAPAMAALAGIAIFYLLFGEKFPGILSHTPFSIDKIVEINYMGADLESIFGVLLGISASYIALYVLFGSFINKTSIGIFFNNLCNAIAGKTIGGPAKVAVFSSGLFGMISGSGTSNVYTTGTFTIPMMKKLGFRPEFAGAVEATASTGGQYMPPVMGAAAFIMSEITGIAYVKIVISAFISAVLFYFTLYVLVHFESIKYRDHLNPNVQDETQDWKKILSQSYLFSPVLVIFVALILGYTPLLAGFYAIVVTIMIGLITRDINFRDLIDALEDGAINTILVAVAVACAGIIMGSITHTGLGLVFLSSVISFAQGNLIVILIIVMITCLILGMGMPTSAAYIMAVTLAAPVLYKFNLNILAIHLFCFYFAIISEVTPPVAICAYAAAGIAGADPTKTGIEAFKLSIAGMIVPFAFIYNDALIAKGSLWEIIYSIFFALLGLVIIAKGISGYFANQTISTAKSLKLKYLQLLLRLGLILLGIAIIFIPYIFKIIQF